VPFEISADSVNECVDSTEQAKASSYLEQQSIRGLDADEGGVSLALTGRPFQQRAFLRRISGENVHRGTQGDRRVQAVSGSNTASQCLFIAGKHAALAIVVYDGDGLIDQRPARFICECCNCGMQWPVSEMQREPRLPSDRSRLG
jgi:hypothetical protein